MQWCVGAASPVQFTTILVFASALASAALAVPAHAQALIRIGASVGLTGTHAAPGASALRATATSDPGAERLRVRVPGDER